MAGKSKKKKSTTPSPAAMQAIHDLVGRLEVPSGEGFTAEVWITMDVPNWMVRLKGSSKIGTEIDTVLGQNQPHLLISVPHLDDGIYVLSITATLQNPGGRFLMLAKSSSDEERCEFGTIPGKPAGMRVMPVRVG